MERVRITGGSAGLKDEPGRYYVLVSPINPTDAWQAAFLGVAEKDTDGRRLALKVDGSTITYRLLEGKTTAECERMIQRFMDQVGPRKCSVLGCGAEMRRGRPDEHPKDCPGRVMAPYNGFCDLKGKLYLEHLVCTRMGSHRVNLPV